MKYYGYALALMLVLGLIVLPVSAQQTASCGDILTGEFNESEQAIDYLLSLESGDSFNIRGSAASSEFAVVVLSPSEAPTALSNDGYNDAQPVIEPTTVDESGEYLVRVSNAGLWSDGRVWTQDGGMGAFQLEVTCTLSDGTVVEASDTPMMAMTHIDTDYPLETASCGDAIKGEFTENPQAFDYVLLLAEGASATVTATDDSATEYAIGLYPPDESEGTLSEGGYIAATPSVTLSSSDVFGEYIVRVSNAGLWDTGELWTEDGGTGTFSFEIACEGNESVSMAATDTETEANTAEAAPSAPPALIPAVDLTAGSMTLFNMDTDNTAVVSPTRDTITYTFEAIEGAVLDLEINKLSGQTNGGFALMGPDGSTVFATVMGGNDTLLTSITLPTEGEYMFGVFYVPSGGEDTVHTTYTFIGTLSE